VALCPNSDHVMTDHLWTPWRMPYLQGEKQPIEGCVFCHKVTTEDDTAEHVLVRGETCFVTLNRYPYNNGHLMVVPYAHLAAITELDTPTLTELMTLTQRAASILIEAFKPQGFNIGINQGHAGGAGIAEHLHQHIVPRWGGDTNYLTVVGETRTIPEWLDQTYERLHALWNMPPGS